MADETYAEEQDRRLSSMVTRYKANTENAATSLSRYDRHERPHFVIGWLRSNVLTIAEEHARCRRKPCAVCAALGSALAIIDVDRQLEAGAGGSDAG